MATVTAAVAAGTAVPATKTLSRNRRLPHVTARATRPAPQLPTPLRRCSHPVLALPLPYAHRTSPHQRLVRLLPLPLLQLVNGQIWRSMSCRHRRMGQVTRKARSCTGHRPAPSETSTLSSPLHSLLPPPLLKPPTAPSILSNCISPSRLSRHRSPTSSSSSSAVRSVRTVPAAVHPLARLGRSIAAVAGLTRLLC